MKSNKFINQEILGIISILIGVIVILVSIMLAFGYTAVYIHFLLFWVIFTSGILGVILIISGLKKFEKKKIKD